MKCGGNHRTEDHGKPPKSASTQLAYYAYGFAAIAIYREEGVLLTLREGGQGPPAALRHPWEA